MNMDSRLRGNDGGGQFTRYASYKDSGVEWLEKVPENWAIVRLKDLGFLQNGVSKGGDYFGSGFPFISYGNVYNDTVSPTKIKAFANSTPEDQQAYSCKSGDVFFTRTSETIEEIGFAATCLKTIPEAVFSGFVIRFRPTTNKLVPDFSNFYFSAKILRGFFSKEIALVTRASLGQGLLNKLSVILPSASEQRSIANYLDIKTAQIDRKIELLSQKAEKYGKLKQSLINETVTRGLDKSVPMKNSGIEWIGDIPVHWTVCRISDLAVQNKVKNKGLVEKNLLSLSYGRLIRKDLDASFGLLPESFESYQVIKTGNIILRLTDLQNDKKSLRVGLAREKGIITSAYLGLCFNRSINPIFSYYLLHVYDLSKVFYWFGGGLRSTMRFDDVKVIPFIVPPLDEQQDIAAYLDEKTSKIDQIVETVHSQINNLKELRKTLINDVVTGKIKVIGNG